MKMPSKEEIKDRYNILDSDFEILTEIPSEQNLQEKGGFLLRVADCLGFKTWMWKSFGGIILAIIIIPPQVASISSFWTPKIQKSYISMNEYWESFSADSLFGPLDYVAFVSEDQEQKHPTGPLPIDQYPLGTGVFPLSSKWSGPTGQWLG